MSATFSIEDMREMHEMCSPKTCGYSFLLALLDEREKRIGELEGLKQLVIQELPHLEYQIKCLEGAGLHSGSLPEIYKMLLAGTLKGGEKNDRD